MRVTEAVNASFGLVIVTWYVETVITLDTLLLQKAN